MPSFRFAVFLLICFSLTTAEASTRAPRRVDESTLSQAKETLDSGPRLRFKISNVLGHVFLAGHRYGEAADFFEDALRRAAPGSAQLPFIHKALAQSYHMSGDAKAAISHFERAEELLAASPVPLKQEGLAAERASVATSLGYLFLSQRQYPEAIKRFDKALRLVAPASAQARLIYEGLGQACRESGDAKAAISHFERAEELLPLKQEGLAAERASVATSLGYLFLSQRQCGKASEYFDKVLRSASADPHQMDSIYRSLAHCRYESRACKTAIPDMEKRLAEIPAGSFESLRLSKEYFASADECAVLFLADLKAQLKSPLSESQAVDLLKDTERYALKKEKVLLDRSVWRLLDKYSEMQQGRSAKEIAVILDRERLFVKDAALAHLFWGNRYVAQRDFDGARREFSSILSVNPDSPVAYAALIQVYFKEGKIWEALESFLKAKRIVGAEYYEPLHRYLIPIYAEIMKRIRSPKEASRVAADFSKRVPQYRGVIYSALTWIYIQNNLLDKAERSANLALEYNAAQKGSPPHADWPHVALGRIHLRRGNLPQAEASFKRALALDRNSFTYVPPTCTALELGDLYRQWGRMADARATYARAIKTILEDEREDLLGEGLGQAYLKLGSLSLQEGGARAALQFYRMSLEYDSSVKEAASRQVSLLESQSAGKIEK